MITYITGDLFDSEAQVLVNPVNTAGAMGRGLALQFKRRCPQMFAEYRERCASGQFDIGVLWLYTGMEPWVLNFPTKKHWRSPSKAAYIEAGLLTFRAEYAAKGIESIAFPKLGSGLGGLDFSKEVQPLMEQHLSDLPLEITVYV